MNERNPSCPTTNSKTMKLLKKDYFSTALAAVVAAALLAIGLTSTALAADTPVFKADTYNAGGSVQSGWTGLLPTNAVGPWTSNFPNVGGSGITVDLSAGSGNSGTRTRGLPTAGIVNGVDLNTMYQGLVFAAGGFDIKLTGLTASKTYKFNIYSWDPPSGNSANIQWKYSLAGNRTSPVDAGYVWQPNTALMTPAANTGITLAQKGTTLLSTTFVATGTSVNFFSTGTVVVLNGFELYEVVTPVAANAGVDKTVTPSAPSVQIGGSPTALGGTAPYTYLWSPSGSLDDATLANPTATLSAPGTTTYTVTVTDSLSVTSSDTMTVTWPALAANAGADKSLTPSAPSAVLGGSPSAIGGTPSYTYKWTPSTGLSSDSVANPTASPAVTTVYTLEITDSALVVASDTVTVNYPLAANAGPDRSLSPLTPSAQIGGSPTANGGTGPFTYSWSPSTDLSSDTVANPIANPTTTTTYTVTVTDTATSETVQDSVTVTYTVPNANLISVDFKQGSGTTCSGDTTLTGTTMKNAVNNTFTGQLGNWNALNIGTYNQNSAISGLLTNGGGVATTVKLALGRAITGLDNTAAGGWRCSPGEGALGGPDQLRSESAYLYFPTLTVDHFAWALTGLTPNANYRLTLFGSGSNTFTNIANSVAGVADAEGDWNWASIQADENGVIAGTLLTTGSNQTFGLYGLQIEGAMPLLPALVANAGADQTYTDTPVSIGGSPTASGGAGSGYTYSWSPSTGLSSATAANPTAAPAATTSYTVTVNDGVSTAVSDSVIVTVGVVTTPYQTWADANAGGGLPGEDFNNDGVENGIAYFMGMNGLATNPGVVGGSVTWPYVNAVSSYTVQTSDDLSPTGWTDVLPDDPRLHDTGVGGSVTYDLLPPGPGRLFVRMVVTP